MFSSGQYLEERRIIDCVLLVGSHCRNLVRFRRITLRRDEQTYAEGFDDYIP